jgi:hypothetical protein
MIGMKPLRSAWGVIGRIASQRVWRRWSVRSAPDAPGERSHEQGDGGSEPRGCQLEQGLQHQADPEQLHGHAQRILQPIEAA